MIGHYPLDVIDRAPRVRISRLRDALDAICDLTFFSGDRKARRKPLDEFKKRLGDFDAVYVESSSSYSTISDFMFLWACKRAGLPVGLYIRDAYQFYPFFYDDSTLKNKVLKWLWYVTVWVYERTASILFFPTEGLSSKFKHPKKLLLPPGGRLVEGVDRSKVERRVMYTGWISEEHGADLLLTAMDLVVAQVPDAKLTLICTTPDHPLLAPWKDRPWLDMMTRSTDDLLPEMNRCMVAVIPFRPNDYPALPVKTMDTLSYGLPLVVTPWKDVKEFVERHGCGVLADPTPEGLAAALVAVLLDPDRAAEFSRAAIATIARGNTWQDRARYLVECLSKSSKSSEF